MKQRLLLILTLVVALAGCATHRRDTPATVAPSAILHAHIAHSIDTAYEDRKSFGVTNCYLYAVKVDTNGQPILHNAFAMALYPDAQGGINANLPAGTYRLTLYTSRVSQTPKWTKIVTVGPLAPVDLGEIDAAP